MCTPRSVSQDALAHEANVARTNAGASKYRNTTRRSRCWIGSRKRSARFALGILDRFIAETVYTLELSEKQDWIKQAFWEVPGFAEE